LLIIATSGFSMEAAVGTFVVTALMIIVTGFFAPLMRLVERIPASVSSGMLAGILAAFVVGAAKAVMPEPLLILPLVVLFFVFRLWNPSLAVLAVLVCGTVYAFLLNRMSGLPVLELASLKFIHPQFSIGGVLGLALPLYLVTMASQNLAGLAVLRAAGYAPAAGPILCFTGLISLLTAPLGAHTTNLAAISAAICTGPDVHPDPKQRWLTGPFYAATYLFFALFAATFVSLFAMMPRELIALIAGLALIASFGNALDIALKEPRERIAAIATFATTASGISFFGVGAAFWGLMAGLAILGLERMKHQ
jgi:benzoate membrane transport protein